MSNSGASLSVSVAKATGRARRAKSMDCGIVNSRSSQELVLFQLQSCRDAARPSATVESESQQPRCVHEVSWVMLINLGTAQRESTIVNCGTLLCTYSKA